jgi:hypothetical protein
MTIITFHLIAIRKQPYKAYPQAWLGERSPEISNTICMPIIREVKGEFTSYVRIIRESEHICNHTSKLNAFLELVGSPLSRDLCTRDRPMPDLCIQHLLE